YTENYAVEFAKGNKDAVQPYVESAVLASSLGMGLNAGHDLSLDSLQYFAKKVPNLLEVSIGHALISEALYFGLQNVVNMYLQKLI
ncbi:MAG: pyridoxine 5'-phosphate synthase, partial [Flavobacteriaceae bacterium]|nr:pyridoxine 5'-phosphate synthase [Flavobacteriaceae bacterium]